MNLTSSHGPVLSTASQSPEYAYKILGEEGFTSPRSIYGIGRNYLKHIEELKNSRPDEPVVFLKSQASLRTFGRSEPDSPEGGEPVTADQSSFYPFLHTGLHFEAEIVVLIGSVIPLGSEPTPDAIRALGLGLDLTRRTVQDDLKAKGLPWARAKNFAGSAMVTPFVPLTPEVDLTQLGFRFFVNNVQRQAGQSGLMIFPILNLLKSLAMLHPLVPGDLIFTGTPEGVGPLQPGDLLTLEWTTPWVNRFTQIF